jgi:hypothetical protein
VYKVTRNAFGRRVFRIRVYVIAVLLFLLRQILLKDFRCFRRVALSTVDLAGSWQFTEVSAVCQTD